MMEVLRHHSLGGNEFDMLERIVIHNFVNSRATQSFELPFLLPKQHFHIERLTEQVVFADGFLRNLIQENRHPNILFFHQ